MLGLPSSGQPWVSWVTERPAPKSFWGRPMGRLPVQAAVWGPLLSPLQPVSSFLLLLCPPGAAFSLRWSLPASGSLCVEQQNAFERRLWCWGSGAPEGCRADAEHPRVPTLWAERWALVCVCWGAGSSPHVSLCGPQGLTPARWAGFGLCPTLPPPSLSLCCGQHTGSLPPHSGDRGTPCSPVHLPSLPACLPGRHPLGSALLLLPIHWAPSHPNGACLIDSICPTVKTLHRCQPPGSPPPGSQQTPAKDRRLGVLPGTTTGCREASDPPAACWEPEWVARMWPGMREPRSHRGLRDVAWECWSESALPRALRVLPTPRSWLATLELTPILVKLPPSPAARVGVAFQVSGWWERH